MLRCEDAYAELCDQAPPGPLPDFVDEIGWLIEELRVSLFAQTLRTRVPVSEKRVMAAIGRGVGARLRSSRCGGRAVAGRLGAMLDPHGSSTP